MSQAILVFISLVEVILLAVLVLFFLRLKRSEALLTELQARQEEFVNKLHFNSELEAEMVLSFQERQKELAGLDQAIERRAAGLKQLIAKAESITRSPDTLKQMVLGGHRRGQSPAMLAKATGLSLEEVELILMQARA